MHSTMRRSLTLQDCQYFTQQTLSKMTTDTQLFSGTTKLTSIEYVGTGELQSFNMGSQVSSVQVINLSDSDTIAKKPNGFQYSECILEKTIGSSLKRAKILENGITIDGANVIIGTSTYINTVGQVYILEVQFK